MHTDYVNTPMSLGQLLQSVEREILFNALVESKQNHTLAARTLGVTFRAFRYRAKLLGLNKNADQYRARSLGQYWPKLRMDALRKYGNRCQCCGASPNMGASLEVDHIKPRHLFPELEFSIDNLQVLCSACHGSKGSFDQTDWRGQ